MLIVTVNSISHTLFIELLIFNNDSFLLSLPALYSNIVVLLVSIFMFYPVKLPLEKLFETIYVLPQ